jgi:hypothetical protein
MRPRGLRRTRRNDRLQSSREKYDSRIRRHVAVTHALVRFMALAIAFHNQLMTIANRKMSP